MKLHYLTPRWSSSRHGLILSLCPPPKSFRRSLAPSRPLKSGRIRSITRLVCSSSTELNSLKILRKWRSEKRGTSATSNNSASSPSSDASKKDSIWLRGTKLHPKPSFRSYLYQKRALAVHRQSLYSRCRHLRGKLADWTRWGRFIGRYSDWLR